MATFSYVARDTKTGEKTEGEVEAQNQAAASSILAGRNLAPLDISLRQQSSALGSFRSRVSTKHRVIFSRQLSTLINAGLPLVQSLTTVEEQTSNKPLKQIIANVVTSIEAGSSLADSLAKYPRVFDGVYVSLIAAGETSGTLDKALERLATQQEKDAEIIARVRGAMMYPLIVLLALFAIVIFLMTTVLPQVEILYKNLPGAQLPIFTRILLGATNLIKHFWWLAILILGAIGFFAQRWLRTFAGKSFIDSVTMKTWPVKELFMKLYMARFARTASTLVGSGVPMIKMLSTAADAVGNVHIAASIRAASDQVKGGKSLSESIQGDPNFLPLVPNMIHIGEQSGALEDMLSKVADYYEREVDNQIKTVSTLVEPVLMIFVGVIALIIVAAVLLPIYGLAGKNLTNI